jgi:hypothetical protein
MGETLYISVNRNKIEAEREQTFWAQALIERKRGIGDSDYPKFHEGFRPFYWVA